MAQTIPRTTQQWNVSAQDGTAGFDALVFSEQPVPELGDSQVLVKLEAVTLNYRDLLIVQGKYPSPSKANVVPGSDGAGTVLAVGRHVTRFKPGDGVVTNFSQEHIGGRLTAAALGSALGGGVDGTLRTVGAFNEQGLVHRPAGLSAAEAAALPCAGLTAWNALHGSAGAGVAAGDWVLTQGTGGVSLFALQFAKAAGARVIATTGSRDKEPLLRALGADHVVNYRDTPAWGAAARALTGGEGVDHIIEVAGPQSMAQSLDAVRTGGVITIIGFVGGTDAAAQPGFLDCLTRQCTARGIMVGSRAQMEDMCRALAGAPDRLRPVLDKRVFALAQLKEACAYQWSGQHVGKVVIEMP